jgi:O-methyltransferase involved in polyketide biosynthesis
VPPIELTGVQRTLLIPLYARALDYRSPRPILNDRTSDELVRRIDFDFTTLGVVHGNALLAVRARQLDAWTREYLDRQPTATVVNLGCGLDTRYDRVRPPATVRWFDVDFPEVIDFRRQFFPEGQEHRTIATSLTAPGWLDAVDRDRPGIAIADGVLEYLAPTDVADLLRRVVGHFREGEVAFDVMGQRMVRSANRRLSTTVGGELRWGVDDLRTVDAIDPRLRRTATTSIFTTPFTPAKFRALYVAFALSPGFRRTIRLLRYAFP